MDPILILIQIAVLLMSVVIHEVSHGMTANYLGDPTAKYAGRLSLNPLKHLDLWGSFLIPLFLIIFNSPFLFGYAKPVPYNPHNLKNKKWGPALVAAAGPLSNLIIVLIFGLTLRFLPIGNSIYFNNLVNIFVYIVILNLVLAVFNTIPIPPLDGSKIISAVLPCRYQTIIAGMEKYGMILVLFFVFFLFQYLTPVILWLFKIIAGSRFI
jgi:Zn-dependent protease